MFKFAFSPRPPIRQCRRRETTRAPGFRFSRGVCLCVSTCKAAFKKVLIPWKGRIYLRAALWGVRGTRAPQQQFCRAMWKITFWAADSIGRTLQTNEIKLAFFKAFFWASMRLLLIHLGPVQPLMGRNFLCFLAFNLLWEVFLTDCWGLVSLYFSEQLHLHKTSHCIKVFRERYQQYRQFKSFVTSTLSHL